MKKRLDPREMEWICEPKLYITGSDRIVIETDSPYMSPEPLRGRRNDSRNLKYIVEKLAEIKDVPVEEAIRATTENGKRLFGITEIDLH